MIKYNLTVSDRILLLTVDKEIYATYVCKTHGVYQWNRSKEYKGCIICFNRHNAVEPEVLLGKEII